MALAEWLARVQPDGFASTLPTFAAADQPPAVGGLVVTAVSQHPEQKDRILRSWMAVAGERGWAAALGGAFGGSDLAASDAALFVDALNAAQAHVREETVWFVLQMIVGKFNLPARIVDAAAASREGAAAWEAFGRELIARRGKPPDGSDRRQLIETQGRTHMSDIYRIAAAPQLTAAERSAAAALATAPREPFADADQRVAFARTTPALVPGAIAGTLRGADCRASGSLVARATMVYASDGFPLHVSVNPTGLSRQCLAAWTAIARTTPADEAEPVREDGQGLMLPLNPDFIACADAAAAPEPDTPRLVPTSRIAPPRKTKDVKPDYPSEAMNQRIQGVVVLKGIVSRSGCVSSLRLVRSIPGLDAAAMAAVSRWKFEPTLLDGVPVSVVMTVTVNFTLQ
jgi:TonB family protein